eukprot:GHVP01020849.1.p1 GENE.GHVP01020849.1~~GHVP01020849.1.p1  ORF type:complete len:130 (+),score=15.19 GHVP01020849.1:127-516(+)
MCGDVDEKSLDAGTSAYSVERSRLRISFAFIWDSPKSKTKFMGKPKYFLGQPMGVPQFQIIMSVAMFLTQPQILGIDQVTILVRLSVQKLAKRNQAKPQTITERFLMYKLRPQRKHVALKMIQKNANVF